MELQAAWDRVRRAFAEAKLDNPDLDASILMQHATGFGRIDRIARPSMPLDADCIKRLEAMMRRRLNGEPVHRIIGRRGFYGLDLELSPATLEPRPDTEVLVDKAVELARAVVRAKGACRIADLGTGTGAIALAILSSVPHTSVVATDVEAGALEAARRNAEMHGLSDRVSFQQSDWFSTVSGPFDIIASNPPYISSAEMSALPREVRDHDPHLALDGGPDGLEAYRRIAAGARDFLDQDGHVVLETGYDQKDSVSAIFTGHGYRMTEAVNDLGGNHRVVVFAP